MSKNNNKPNGKKSNNKWENNMPSLRCQLKRVFFSERISNFILVRKNKNRYISNMSIS